MKNILMITPNIPSFDTNAGDWRVFTLCKALTRAYRVYLLPLSYSWNGGRHERIVKNVGIRIVYPGINNAARFERFLREKKIETMIFRSEYSMSGFEKYFRSVKNVVVDTHELRYEKLERNISLLSAEKRKGYIKRLQSFKEKELLNLERADTLITVSDLDANKLMKYFPGKKIITIHIPGDTPVKAFKYPDFGNRKGLVFFGNYGLLTPNDDAVRYFLKDIFPRVQKMLPGVTFTVLGYLAETYKDMWSDVLTKGHVHNILEEISKYRVFVCPLRYGAGVKKKVIDALMSKTPVVATSVGFEGVEVMPGSDILVADDPQEFARCIADIYCNERKWSRIGLGGYRRAVKHYSQTAFEKQVERFCKILA